MENNIKIAAVGDLMLGDHPVRFGHGVRSRIEDVGADELFIKVKQVFKSCDFVFGNLEVAHSDIGLIRERIESMEFRASPLSITAIKKAGINIVNFANNHCMEHGHEAFFETINLLKKNEISIAGIKAINNRCVPVELYKKDCNIVILAYSLRPENYCKNSSLLYALSSEDAILEEVKSYKNRKDILVISLHWGEEFMNYPSPMQVIFANRLINAGANIILGHHPHVLQGIELYRGAVIAYSLGNFIFDMWQKCTRETMILKLQCFKKRISYEVIPVNINSLFQAEPVGTLHYKYFFNNIEKLNNKINILYIEKNIDSWKDTKLNAEQKNYLKDSKRVVMRHRLENYLYFLSHVYRYKPSILRQSVSRFISRRIESE
jgi:gamma-polyglutamate biosynthesis protein CapA